MAVKGMIGQCSRCGKQRWMSRADAKRAARRFHPGRHMSVYECDGYWHYGKLPTVIARGIVDRSGMTEYPPSITRKGTV